MKTSKKKVPLKQPAGKVETSTSRPENLSAEGAVLEKALLAAADALLEKAQQLDEWDQRSAVSCDITAQCKAQSVCRSTNMRLPCNQAWQPVDGSGLCMSMLDLMCKVMLLSQANR